ncbi:hypothetical protein KR093_005229, partial [Drosophila rubida]
PSSSPTSSNSSSSSSSSAPTMRSKGGGNNATKRRDKETTVPSTPTLGVNMRVTGQCSQGGRKYMEDQFSVAYQESPLTHELEYAFFGIYDGHGGTEAALFAKEHLMLEIVKQKQFWSDNDEDVLRAIREGYIGTHFAMWREQEKWPRTANGHLSTAGTTATVAFMRREKIYIGHVGDSGIVLGYQNPNERRWRAKQLTTDHKPESLAEKARIQRSGGQVAIKSGVPRVVWNRPRDPMHRGPIRQRTVVDDIPFLAVARSLGDLWSYNSRCKEFVVSPDPDVKVVKIDPNTFRCLIFGTDGLWNVITAQEAVDSVREKHIIGECMHEQDVMNPSKALVDRALKTWATKKMRADNTSVVTVILTPAAESPAPTRTESGAGVVGAETTTASYVDMEMLDLERLDSENKYPSSGTSDLDADELDECAVIEEKEYLHEMPYSALAKRHLPPEPYRNFDYYIEEEDNEAEEEQEQQDIDDDMEHLLQHSKFWRKSIAAWQHPAATRHRHHVVDSLIMERELATDAMDTEPTPAPAETSLYTGELQHSFDSYVSSAGVAATTEYSFAESFNSLLNEQQAARTHQQQQQQQTQKQQQQQQQQHQQQQHQQHGHQQHAGCMQEILQEQQRYQQQEGYSLTQLETRREQQQQQQQVVASSRWQQTTYVEQPAELLALNALLQQERDEEQQLALEREQQQQREQQQLLLVVASSSSSNSTNCSSTQSPFVYAPPWSPNLATLQDNEVTSTLPAMPESKPLPTPTPTPTAAQPEAQPQPQQLPAPQQQQQLPAPQQQQALHGEPKLKRQVRRYRNVPNENHQHMQTRRRQLFKHGGGKGKSFIGAAAAAIVAYGSNAAADVAANDGSNNNSGSNSSVNANHNGSGNNANGASNNNNNNNTNSGSSRRRNVVNNGASVMMTRRSHNLSLAGGGVGGSGNVGVVVGNGNGGVSKRQLRSSILQLGQLGNLDLTKRTLRTRNATSAANNSGAGGGSGNSSRNSSSNNNNNNSNNNNNNSSSNNNNNNNNNSGKVSGKPSHTFSKPATPTGAAPSTQSSVSARRLRRGNEEREQRRSLRRSSALSASNSSSGVVGNGGGLNSVSPFSKPTRLQSCGGGIAARPPPSPKKLNAVIPTLAIGTRAYTAALAAAADLSKRWSLRSSSSSS